MIQKCIQHIKNKIYKYMTSGSKNIYIDNLDNIVDKYNNTYGTIKMKPIDVKSRTYIDFNKEEPKFEVGDHVRMKIFLQNVTFQIGLKKLS